MKTGLFLQATNKKYTGTPVRIITTPIPSNFVIICMLGLKYVLTCFFWLCNHWYNGDEDRCNYIDNWEKQIDLKSVGFHNEFYRFIKMS